jgi:flavodoxin
MNAIVIYESVYGNTRAIAEAIADGLGAQAVTTEAAWAQRSVSMPGGELVT